MERVHVAICFLNHGRVASQETISRPPPLCDSDGEQDDHGDQGGYEVYSLIVHGLPHFHRPLFWLGLYFPHWFPPRPKLFSWY